MSKKSSAGFLPGLIVEGAVIGVVVTLLPKIQLGKPATPPNEAADKRPSLAPERLPPIETNWRTAVSQPQAQDPPPPADPAYVERRLDAAGQQLLSGLSDHLHRHAKQLLPPPPDAQRQSQSTPPPARRTNAFRY